MKTNYGIPLLQSDQKLIAEVLRDHKRERLQLRRSTADVRHCFEFIFTCMEFDC
jgi:hypothetical protein